MSESPKSPRKSPSLSPAEETALSALTDISTRNSSSREESLKDKEKSKNIRSTLPLEQTASTKTLSDTNQRHAAEAIQPADGQAINSRFSSAPPFPPMVPIGFPYPFPFVNGNMYPGPPGKPPFPLPIPPGSFPAVAGYPLQLPSSHIMHTSAIRSAQPAGDDREKTNSPSAHIPTYMKEENEADPELPVQNKKIKGMQTGSEESGEDDGVQATEEEQQQINAAIAAAEALGVGKRDMKYMCQTCSRVFTRLYNLKSHIRSHQGLRPFKCKFCSASFTRNHDLNRHERTHADVKPFTCPVCLKKFSRKDALKRHQRQDAEGKRGICVPVAKTANAVA
ncbi:uncharacterized protein SPPG_03161 [Spizellomyces punctatus DAOM BR117]|uniref:C2H2-type domain-containing protein n=1 Tax=Spizellomyces punctatus (strain DAOM BR117) TaxID=645134 RepID=A0A0L0HKJ2_SPIPD|nr:uncharacterized protein SPPG_03161 [Spizellomyces punctatus DAOM BR117]KND01349.1 hypothetical protein SPPG_03161 [Spizellomyces punctatus DAOM BR117]|eukprot:XP_016609388.1 hypothetical protein SPPG_03161 [Spizellomyces punctatus DAOM BR117]